jgi:UDP-GlcNAc3NAcA epimerase
MVNIPTNFNNLSAPAEKYTSVGAVAQGQNRATARWVSIVGARPQFVKVAPICKAIEEHNRNAGIPIVEHRIVHTGQHYDREMAGIFFEDMEIPKPACNLGVGSGSHGTQIARMIERLEPVLLSEKPDWVIVYGDTNSTMAGALVAARLQFPLAHVEAGCRSADMSMPEEQVRVVADHLSCLLLASSQGAIDNLRREGIGVEHDPRNRHNALVGDVMYDALLQNLEMAESCAQEKLRFLGLESRSYYLLTLHRAVNTDKPERLRAILKVAGELDLPVLFPVHPRTRDVLAASGIVPGGMVRPVAPLGYLEMLAIEKHSRKILTDSGGVQKEAFYLGVPCITLRGRTEWPETVEAGANRVVGIDPGKIREAVYREDPRGSWPVETYGSGDASRKIVNELLAAGEFRMASKVSGGEYVSAR